MKFECRKEKGCIDDITSYKDLENDNYLVCNYPKRALIDIVKHSYCSAIICRCDACGLIQLINDLDLK